MAERLDFLHRSLNWPIRHDRGHTRHNGVIVYILSFCHGAQHNPGEFYEKAPI
jgi:hypothetical protein